MTHIEYVQTLQSFGLTWYTGARVIGISTRQSHRYSTGYPIPQPIAKLLRALVALGRVDV